MKRDRLSIHISDSAEITVEEREDGVKSVKNIELNEICLSAYKAVFGK